MATLKDELEELLEKLIKRRSIKSPSDYKCYPENPDWTNLWSELILIKKLHATQQGVYVINGCLGDSAEQGEITPETAKEVNSTEYKCLYIGKSQNVGKRVRDQFYNKDKSRIIVNAAERKRIFGDEIGYKIAPENPRMLERLGKDMRLDLFYVSEIHLFLFEDTNSGIAGRDIFEILAIQQPDEYPLFNKEFAYRETGYEETDD